MALPHRRRCGLERTSKNIRTLRVLNQQGARAKLFVNSSANLGHPIND